MKILFAKGNSGYGTLRIYSDMFIEVLRKHGHVVDIIDRTVKGEWENISNIADESYDAIMSYQMLAFKAKVLLDKSGKQFDNLKYICLCGDHMIYLNYWLKAIKDNSNNAYLLLGDRNQLSCMRKYYPWIKANSFDKTIGSGIDNIKEYKDRSIDVFFGGTHYDLDQELQEIEKMSSCDKNTAYMLIDYIKSIEGITLETALEDILKKQGRSMPDIEFIDYMEKFVPVDRYVRGYYRNMYIEAALDGGAKVSIFGAGWHKSKFVKYSNFIILEGEATLDKGFEYMVDSKIILNIMPWSRIGMHDRIIGALKAGAICITNTNDIIKNEFGDDCGVRGFGLMNKEEITKDIKWLLSNEKEAAYIAKRGKEKAERDYSIESYYEMVRKCLEEIGGSL